MTQPRKATDAECQVLPLELALLQGAPRPNPAASAHLLTTLDNCAARLAAQRDQMEADGAFPEDLKDIEELMAAVSAAKARHVAGMPN